MFFKHRVGHRGLSPGLHFVLFGSLFLAWSGVALAAPGDVLFEDDFESGFAKWSTTDSNLSGIGQQTSDSGDSSLFTRGGAVSTTSLPVDTTVPFIRISAWVRRGSDRFSEDPEASDEDLIFEYLDASGGWVTLADYPGGRPAGEVMRLSRSLGGAALHPLFQIRVRQTSGSGGPPANRGRGWDYWHVDDVQIVEVAEVNGFDLNVCEEFDQGLGGWTVDASTGRAAIGSQTAHTPPESLAIYGGDVHVSSTPVDLSAAREPRLSAWIRRGSDSFSEDPGRGDDLEVQYLDRNGRWQSLARFEGEDSPGEIFERAWRLPSDALHADFRVRFEMSTRGGWGRWGGWGGGWGGWGRGWGGWGGWGRGRTGSGSDQDYWHVDSVCVASLQASAEWQFEEARWNGSAGEVRDIAGNGHDGFAIGSATTASGSPAASGNPGTCRYAEFDGVADAVEIPHASRLMGSSDLTYTAWIHPRSWNGTRQVMAKSVHGGGTGRAQMGIFSEGGRLVGRAETEAGRIQVSGSLPAVDGWSHVALAFSGDRLTLFVNGSAAATQAFSRTLLVQNGDPMAIGKRVGSDRYFFDGYIDEVRVYRSTLDEESVRLVMNEKHVCAEGATGFRIVHDGSGVHCQGEPIQVEAIDLSGNRITDYGGTITLDTQTGTGSWTRLTGLGSFVDAVPDDGLASYAFAPSDGGVASFALDYADGLVSFDVDAFSGGLRDDDSEGLITFAPSAFSVTATPLTNPVPAVIDDPLTQATAGTSVEVHLAAYGTTPTDSSCGIIESYDGNKPLVFWVDQDDPVDAPLVPTVENRVVSTVRGGTGSQSIAFTEGQAVVRVKYKDVGRVTLRMVDVGAGSDGSDILGTTGSVVFRPADFVLATIENASGGANPGATSPTGNVFTAAGDPFRVIVEARDAEGSRTPSFGKESSPEGLRLVSAALVAPASGRNGTAGDGAIANATDFAPMAEAGAFEGTRFGFDEVGSIRIQASIADGDYLGSGDVLGTPSDPIGRFIPKRLEVSANTPEFTTGCGIGAFTWMGQSFGYAEGLEPVLDVTAVNADGATTMNYAGDWWRLTSASVTNRAFTASGAAVDDSGLPDDSEDPAVDSNGDGTGSLTFSSGSGIALDRSVLRAPFDAEVEFSVDVLDLDGVSYASNPFRVGQASTGNGIDFDVSKRFQFGRLRFDNAHGSERIALRMNLRTQRYDGDVFVDDDSDSCSRIAIGHLGLSPSPGSLSVAPSVTNEPLLAGQSGLVLSAPNDDGTVDIIVNLGPSGANLPWLRYDWPEDGNLDGDLNDDPRARATFGIWSGRDQLIYVRESY